MTTSSLAGKSIPSKVVEIAPGDTFTVHGLSLPEIMTLAVRRKSDLDALFARLQKVAEMGDEAVMSQSAGMLTDLLLSFPDIAAEIIALASGGTDDDIVAKAKALPFGVQVDAIEKTADLTFTPSMPPKKVFEAVIKWFQGAQATIGLVPQA